MRSARRYGAPGPVPRTRRYGFGHACGRIHSVCCWQRGSRSYTPTPSSRWRRSAGRWRARRASLNRYPSRTFARLWFRTLLGIETRLRRLGRPWNSSTSGAETENSCGLKAFFRYWNWNSNYYVEFLEGRYVAIRRGLPFESQSRWSEPWKDRPGSRPRPPGLSPRPVRSARPHQTPWTLRPGCDFPASHAAGSRSSV